MKGRALAAGATVVAMVSTVAWAQKSANVATARALAAHLTKAEFARVPEPFNAEMTAALKVEEIKQGWVKETGPLGKLLSIEKERVTERNGSEVVIVPCRFEKGTVNVIVAFDGKGKVAGLFLTPKRERKTSSVNEAAARAVVAAMAKGDFTGATKDFNSEMTASLTADKLRADWKQMTEADGPFQSQGAMTVEATPAYEVVIIACKFARGTWDYRITFDRSRKIAGLFLVPQKAQPATDR